MASNPSVTYVPASINRNAVLPLLLDLRYWYQRIRVNVSKITLKSGDTEIPFDRSTVTIGNYSVDAYKTDYYIYVHLKNGGADGTLSTLEIELSHKAVMLVSVNGGANAGGYIALDECDDNDVCDQLFGISPLVGTNDKLTNSDNNMVLAVTKKFRVRSVGNGDALFIIIYPLEIIE